MVNTVINGPHQSKMFKAFSSIIRNIQIQIVLRMALSHQNFHCPLMCSELFSKRISKFLLRLHAQSDLDRSPHLPEDIFSLSATQYRLVPN